MSSDGARVASIPFQNDRFLRRVPASAYELAVLRSQPLAYWRLNHWDRGAPLISEGRLALAGAANPGIAPVDNGAAEGIAGGPASAAQFESGHEGIDVEDAALSDVSNCTYEAWVLPAEGLNGPRRIYSTFDRPHAGLAIGVVNTDWYRLPSKELRFHLTVYGFYDCMSKTPILPNEWVHLAATIDAGGAPLLYVNGEPAERSFRDITKKQEDEELNPDEPAWLKEDVERQIPWTDEGPTTVGRATKGVVRIGRNPLGAEGQISPEQWAGQISNVAVYDRVLSPDEIQRHFRAARESRLLQQDVKSDGNEQLRRNELHEIQ